MLPLPKNFCTPIPHVIDINFGLTPTPCKTCTTPTENARYPRILLYIFLHGKYYFDQWKYRNRDTINWNLELGALGIKERLYKVSTWNHAWMLFRRTEFSFWRWRQFELTPLYPPPPPPNPPQSTFVNFCFHPYPLLNCERTLTYSSLLSFSFSQIIVYTDIQTHSYFNMIIRRTQAARHLLFVLAILLILNYILHWTIYDDTVELTEKLSKDRQFLDSDQQCKVPKLNPYHRDVLPFLNRTNVKKCTMMKYADVTSSGVLKLKAKNVQRAGIFYIKRIDDFNIELSKRISLLKHKPDYSGKSCLLFYYLFILFIIHFFVLWTSTSQIG